MPNSRIDLAPVARSAAAAGAKAHAADAIQCSCSFLSLLEEGTDAKHLQEGREAATGMQSEMQSTLGLKTST